MGSAASVALQGRPFGSSLNNLLHSDPYIFGTTGLHLQYIVSIEVLYRFLIPRLIVPRTMCTLLWSILKLNFFIYYLFIS